jgi:hypothetical protein
MIVLGGASEMWEWIFDSIIPSAHLPQRRQRLSHEVAQFP